MKQNNYTFECEMSMPKKKKNTTKWFESIFSIHEINLCKFTDAHRNFRKKKTLTRSKLKSQYKLKIRWHQLTYTGLFHAWERSIWQFLHLPTWFLVPLKLSISFSNQTKSLGDFDGICAKSHITKWKRSLHLR